MGPDPSDTTDPPIPPPAPPGRPASARRPGDRLRVAAAAILVAGVLAATGVWVAADDGISSGEAAAAVATRQVGADAGDTARDRQIERLGGPGLVRTAAFNRWLGSLWHGRRLAWTLGVSAAIVAAACAWIAALSDASVDD